MVLARERERDREARDRRLVVGASPSLLLACLVAFAAAAAASPALAWLYLCLVCAVRTLFSLVLVVARLSYPSIITFTPSITRARLTTTNQPTNQPTNEHGRQQQPQPQRQPKRIIVRVLRACSRRPQVLRVSRCRRRCGDVQRQARQRHHLRHSLLSPMSRSTLQPMRPLRHSLARGAI